MLSGWEITVYGTDMDAIIREVKQTHEKMTRLSLSRQKSSRRLAMRCPCGLRTAARYEAHTIKQPCRGEIHA